MMTAAAAIAGASPLAAGEPAPLAPTSAEPASSSGSDMSGYWRRVASELQASGSLAGRLLAVHVLALVPSADLPDAQVEQLLDEALQSDDLRVLSLATQLTDAGSAQPRREALSRRWSERDPQNLAPLWFGGHAVDDLLAATRGRTHYDSQAYAQVRLMYDAFRRTPITPRESGADPAQALLGPDGDALTLAWGIWSAIAIPSFQPVMTACKEPGLSATPTRAADCRQLGRTMALHTDTRLAASIGTALLRNAARTPDDSELASQLRRTSDWQLERHVEISNRMGGDQAQFAHALRMLTTQGIDSELQAIQATLREHGIPLEPPSDWSQAQVPGALGARQ